MADKLWQLVQTLGSRTATGQVNWERTPDEGRFQVSFPSYTVRIFPEDGRDKGTDYFIEILDDTGSVIESANDVDLGRIASIPPGTAYNAMKELHENARRKAMGVDRAFDAIIRGLGELPYE